MLVCQLISSGVRSQRKCNDAPFFAVLICLLAQPALAQRNCLPHAAAVAKLAQEYRETVVAMGVSTDGRNMFEVFVSQSGTWTLLITDTNKLSCIMAAGVGWSAMPTGDAI